MQKNIIYLSAFFLLLGISCSNPAEKTYNEGAILYQKHCENCHMEDGSGLEALYPPLAGADMLENMGVGAACIIKNGLKGKIIVNGVEFETGMEPIKGLSNVEITNIVNYIHNAWGNKRAFIQLNEVEKTLETCAL
ncbi:c-type cytochrome [Aureispira anguillae]|uniref:Cytochrome c n=1 Tax=Aureispira anguillae TaxID=2864201 RepID=A0A915YC21_9BACT|nr:cytochrome c [Aureispira anguillae]BDS10328.1 cytochrome c [Aureispira anguillae]